MRLWLQDNPIIFNGQEKGLLFTVYILIAW